MLGGFIAYGGTYDKIVVLIQSEVRAEVEVTFDGIGIQLGCILHIQYLAMASSHNRQDHRRCNNQPTYAPLYKHDAKI